MSLLLSPFLKFTLRMGHRSGFVLDAIRRGYRVGITGGTDGVMGRPGACHPGRRLIRECE